MTDSLLDLLERSENAPIGRETPIDARFDAWRRQNPDIVEHVTRLALAAARRGVKRLSMKSLFESARASHLEAAGTGTWKLDNTYTAPLARYLMEQYPELVGKFELRRRSA